MLLLDKDSQPIVFTGTYEPAVDSSNRIMAPARWQPGDKNARFHLLPWPVETESYLLVLPPARWEMLLERLGSGNLADEEAAIVERHIAGEAYAFTMDSVGRFCLPAEYAERIGCRRPRNEDGTENKKAPLSVVLVGRLNKFEIWAAERFKATKLEGRQTVSAVLKTKNMSL